MKDSQTFDFQLFAEEDQGQDDVAGDGIGEELLTEEAKEEKDKKPQTIPYDRFKEVNDEKKELKERLTDVEARNKEYEKYFLSLQKPEAKEPEDETMDWDNPKTEIRKIVDEIVKQKLPLEVAALIRQQKSVDDVLVIYPDLNDDKSPFFKAVAKVRSQPDLVNHPNAIRLACAIVAAEQMPEVLMRAKTNGDEARRQRKTFVEGDNSQERRDVYSLPKDQEELFKAMGLTSTQIKEVAQDLKGGK